jgi:7,8-dihydropterin-6-yl-methyl-4-(beta-D-ribofuranosyl)aminobenzene 5'-phosphate synthase
LGSIIRLKIAVLSNNDTNCGLSAEWGLSIYVEYNGKKILIDSGLGKLFLENAKKMNIDLSKIDYAILTHGHFDHSNGFENLVGKTLYTHKDAFKPKYSLRNGAYEFAGIKFEQKNMNCIFNENFVEISKGVFLSGGIPRPHGTPKHHFYFKENQGYVPDNILDEQLIIFEVNDGIVVVSGCTHFGVQNMTDFIKTKFPNKKVKALFAGLHLFSLSKREQEKVVDYLVKENLYEKIYALHCTGEYAAKLLEQKGIGKHTFVGEIFEF